MCPPSPIRPADERRRRVVRLLATAALRVAARNRPATPDGGGEPEDGRAHGDDAELTNKCPHGGTKR